jgi:hypothetical protein
LALYLDCDQFLHLMVTLISLSCFNHYIEIYFLALLVARLFEERRRSSTSEMVESMTTSLKDLELGEDRE